MRLVNFGYTFLGISGSGFCITALSFHYIKHFRHQLVVISEKSSEHLQSMTLQAAGSTTEVAMPSSSLSEIIDLEKKLQISSKIGIVSAALSILFGVGAAICLFMKEEQENDSYHNFNTSTVNESVSLSPLGESNNFVD